MTDFNEMSETFRLYNLPSFTEGMTMALDYAQTMPEFNVDATPALADGKALSADWKALGSDFAAAMEAHAR